MPTYQYVCTECGDQIEAVQKFSDDPLTVHDWGQAPQGLLPGGHRLQGLRVLPDRQPQRLVVFLGFVFVVFLGLVGFFVVV